jgi:pyruvate kinase
VPELPSATEGAAVATAEPDAIAEPEGVAEASASEPEADTSGHTQAQAVAGAANGATVTGADLSAVLQVGDRVLLADGAAELRVTAIDGRSVTTEVIHGGLIRSRCGVNIPSERFGDGGLTDDDRAAVPRALELRVDLLAQSFVRSAADVVALKALLPADGPRVVAKIETRAALDDFDAICAAADGIMVARGDLGVDIPFEDVPMIQKDLVQRATAAGRFSIVATQMLESMIGEARPTRAEASDVANAVLDGADAVMLSAETAIGAHPLEALRAMERICRAAEKHDPAPAVRAADPSTAVAVAATTMAARRSCYRSTGRRSRSWRSRSVPSSRAGSRCAAA